MLAAREEINLVAAIDADRGDFFISPAVGRLAPALGDFVGELPRANHYSHNFSSVTLSYATLCASLYIA